MVSEKTSVFWMGLWTEKACYTTLPLFCVVFFPESWIIYKPRFFDAMYYVFNQPLIREIFRAESIELQRYFRDVQ